MKGTKFCKIKSITNQPPQDVYYMKVRNNENFFGNNICLHNCGYRGDLGIKMYNLSDKTAIIQKGQACAQFIVYKMIPTRVDWAYEKTESTRGEKGFRSSDKNGLGLSKKLSEI